MKKGFTLLELLVVIIILGVLATLGFTQYGRMIERSRGAEARVICGDIRKFAAGHRLETGTLAGMTNANVGIGTAIDQIPSACTTTHWFSYNTAVAEPTITITATRCGATGKAPAGGASAGNTLTLISNLTTGTDAWGGTGNY